MFDFAFSELALIGVVALVVIGPERLPRVARTAGVVVGRLQRYAATVKADIAREVELSELRRMQSDIKSAAQSFESSMRESLASAEAQFQQAQQTVMGGPQPTPASLAAADAAIPSADADDATFDAAAPGADGALDSAAAAIGAPSPDIDALPPAPAANPAHGPASTPAAGATSAPGPYAEDPFHFPAAAPGAARTTPAPAAQSSLFSVDEAPPGDGLAAAAAPSGPARHVSAPVPPA